ncbi:MAG TPA: hypothetical protein VHX88_19335 [Solirubrobacteraceae bacterium]|nr:hypothetical protein [Solirubrobacteraceae bacterium]
MGAPPPPDGGAPPLNRRPKPELRSEAHFFSAATKVGEVVLTDPLLNTGPVPEKFGAGRVTPLVFMQATNFVTALLYAVLLRKFPLAPAPPAGNESPHFFSAAAIFGLLAKPARPAPAAPAAPPPNRDPPPPAGRPVGGRVPVGRVGRVIPAFERQLRIAAKRAPPAARPPAGVVVAAGVPVAALLVVVLLLDPPQAASRIEVASTATTTSAERLRSLVLLFIVLLGWWKG